MCVYVRVCVYEDVCVCLSVCWPVAVMEGLVRLSETQHCIRSNSSLGTKGRTE